MGYHKCESLASEFMLWTYSVWVHLGSCGLLWAHLGSGSSERIYLPGQGRLESKCTPNINLLNRLLSPPPFREPDPTQKCLHFQVTLLKTDHLQLRPLYHPFREPDPSQKCLHFQLTFSLKVLIFSSGCLPALSGSRTRARNAYMSY